MNIVNTVLTWIIVSSKDPQAFSLTLKGTLVAVATFITMAAGLAHIQTGDLTPVIDGVIALVQLVLVTISSAIALWGLVRKIYLTATGQNQAINTL